jgi:predicted nuclease with TOPRIM domain
MAEKIAKKELTKLQDLVKNYNQHQLKLGELEVEKHRLLHSISNVQEELQKFQDELKETYGEVSIDINDGKIAKNEPSKED